jgi:hypothetical protein
MVQLMMNAQLEVTPCRVPKAFLANSGDALSVKQSRFEFSGLRFRFSSCFDCVATVVTTNTRAQQLPARRMKFCVLLDAGAAVENQVMDKRCVFGPGIALLSMLTVGVALASSSWQKEDPSQWTSEDIYQILNSSPWSKAVKVNVAKASGYGSPGAGNGGTWGGGGGQIPGIGMGRGGGMGGGGMGRGRGNGGYPPADEPTVTVQWESALPVRLAQAKSDSGKVDTSAIKPLNQYVIAVIGLPKSGFESRSSSSPDDDSDDARLAEHLKVIAVLSVGHERLGPTKVELNQGRDNRTIFHFEKSEPITLQDKDVEFRITSDHMDLRKKFALKEMQYQGKLEL